MEQILHRINDLRNGKNTSEFARFLEIPQTTLDGYLSGKRKLSVDLIIRVCVKCNADARYILGLIDSNEVPIKHNSTITEKISKLKTDATDIATDISSRMNNLLSSIDKIAGAL